jgi:DNA (cytosine-5)-methyltransferase 1
MREPVTYLSVCSGIEAATVAWEPLGWEAVGFSEIEAFPRAVLSHHYPHVPLYGDFTQLIENPPACDVLVGGPPCQAFSVAGLRQSLGDARGALTLGFVQLANAIDESNHAENKQPCVVVYENVGGILSTKDNAFGCLLAGLAGEDVPLLPPRGGWTHSGVVLGPRRAVAWRVLDAQYFGLPQRRVRCFVVASARDGFDPSEVLFEPASGDGYSPSQRKSEEEAAAAARVRATGHIDVYLGNAEGGAVTVPFFTKSNLGKSLNNQTPLVAHVGDVDDDESVAVRRLTPLEVERCFGFADDWTRVPYRGKPPELCPDGPRFQALGNSMAVNVMRWLGERIDAAL